MTHDLSLSAAHPVGGQSAVEHAEMPAGIGIDSFTGPVRVEWDRDAALTALGHLSFFIDFLKTAGLFEAFVADCPLRYTSPNAPKARDVLGTAMLSILSGHTRYAHIAALRGDAVVPELLGMKRIVSEDAVRRAFVAIEEEAGAAWLRLHLDDCTAPLLAEPWILDMDTTVKPLYGRREGAVVGYNPQKPGRPSHCYHTYSVAGPRLVLDVDVRAGNEHTSKHSAPGLAYLFKLRLTANVQRAIERLSSEREWVDAGQGWQAKESAVRLAGWSRQRRIIVLRRRVKGALAASSRQDPGPPQLSFLQIGPGDDVHEYCVLATSLVEDLASFGQLYRDRGDAENIFDELKNQWGWGGFTTHDLARCRLAARLVALFYNWWNIFVRLAEPDWHREAITSRPLLLHAIATRSRHARQTTLTIASSHAKSVPAAKALRAVAMFLRALVKTAEQLTASQRWAAILARAFQAFLNGRPLRLPPRLAPS